MSVLSFSSGRPIAKVVGGELDGQLIHIKEEKDEDEPYKEESYESDYDSECEGCGFECCGYCHPKKCLKKPCCEDCTVGEGDDYDDEEELDVGTKFTLPSGKFQPVPNIDKTETIFIGGPAGSGKSTLASKYLETYKKLFPQNPIIIFSRKDKDEVLDRLKPYRFTIDESIITEPPDLLKELTGGACILFDDCIFSDDKINKVVQKLIDEVLQLGRSYSIYCVIVSHLLNEGKKTKVTWSEVHSVTIFPKSGNRYAMNYALEKYCGLDKKTRERILNLPSRWVTIGKQYPMYVLSEKHAELI